MDDDLEEYEDGEEAEYTPDPLAWYAVSLERLVALVEGARVRSVEMIRGGMILWLENEAGELIAGLPVGWDGCNPGAGGV